MPTCVLSPTLVSQNNCGLCRPCYRKCASNYEDKNHEFNVDETSIVLSAAVSSIHLKISKSY